MIKPWLWAESGDLRVGGPYTWHIIDFDQKRFFSVTYDPPTPLEDVEESEEFCLAQLRKHIDELPDGVYGISFSEPDGPITVSTDPKDDATQCVNCHPLSAFGLSYPVKTIYLSSLTELSRLSAQVDLVAYRETPAVNLAERQTTVAFKYWFMEHGMFRTWLELSNWSRLPRDHPHIVPFDSVVLDDVTDKVVGFTSIFVPGGTLWDTATTRTFRLQWLHQLLKVVDELNYHYGVMHQDIAPRNIVINGDNLQIFDFNYAIMIGKHYTPDRDDTKGVIFTVYELITLDDHFREVPHAQQDAEAVMGIEWKKHPDVKLDSDVKFFRDVLEKWVVERKRRDFAPQPTWVRWPFMPDFPLVNVPVYGSDGTITGTEARPVSFQFRRDLVKMGEPYWNWERPAGSKLEEGSNKRPKH